MSKLPMKTISNKQGVSELNGGLGGDLRQLFMKASAPFDRILHVEEIT